MSNNQLIVLAVVVLVLLGVTLAVASAMPAVSTAPQEAVSEAWFTTSGGEPIALALGTDGSSIAVNCYGSDVMVMFKFGQALRLGPSVKIGYSADDGVGRIVQAVAVGSEYTRNATIVTSPNSTLMRVIRTGSLLAFGSENTSGEMMIGIVTLKGSTRALQKLPCT